MAASTGNVRVAADDSLQAIVLTGRPEQVAQVEQTIRELDVPSTAIASKDVELTVTILGASSKPGAFSQGQEPSEGMEPVIKQLRAAFPYKNYQVLSTVLMRSREGGGAMNAGVMQGFSYPNSYDINYRETSVSTEQGKPIILVRGFKFETRVRVATGPASNGGEAAATSQFAIVVNTDVNLRENQKVVVGKSNFENSDSALFVVLGARLVE